MFTIVLLAGVGYFLYLFLMSGFAPEVAFLTASASMHTWFWYLAIGLGAVGLLLTMLQIVDFTKLIELILTNRLSHFVLASVGGIGIMGPAGFLMGGLLFALKAGAFLGGSYLLMTSGVLLGTAAAVNFIAWKIIFGAALIILGLIFRVYYTYKVTETVTSSYSW